MIKKHKSTPAHSKNRNYPALKSARGEPCASIHTDGLHVQRWITAEAIEPNYSDNELVEVLQFADIIVSLFILETINLMKDENTFRDSFTKGVRRI